MALTKRTYNDKIEIVGKFRHIQVRQVTVVEEDGREISHSFHRRVLTPNMNLSNEDTEIQMLAGVLWTDEVKKAWMDFLQTEQK